MDTIVALSTPLGVSGVGMIRLSGADCLALAKAIFKKEDIVPRQCIHGSYRTVDGIILDDPLFVYFAENASYTGESMLEISCHGNPLILRHMVQDCIQRGCRHAEPGEFTRRAFLRGKMDLCQAEAVEDLIHSQSIQALQIAQKQLRGHLSHLLNASTEQLIQQIAFVEAYLDFPEEDLPEENQALFQSQLVEMIERFSQLIDAHQFYNPLHQGIQTVIVGQPNAGKSTLFNALLGQERALVSDIPGTTRDFISETFILGSYTLKWMDTAGLHETTDPIERMGIAQTHAQVQSADIIVWVIDGSLPLTMLQKDILLDLPPEKTFVILNKKDLGVNPDIENYVKAYDSCSITLKELASIDQVKQGLLRLLQQRYQNFSQVAFMIHERHAKGLQDARLHLQKALQLFHQGGYADCLAAELKLALHALSCLVGRVDYENVLDQIFSKFCIGK